MSPAEELAFRRQMDGLLPWRIRIAAIACFAANGAFALVDLYSLSGPELSWRTAMRVLFTPLFLAIAALSGTQPGQRYAQELVLALALVQALVLAAIGLVLPPAENVGYFPALLFLCAFLPLPLGRSMAMAGIFVATFLLVDLELSRWPLPLIVRHAGNLLAAGVASVIAAVFSERFARGEFQARQQLATANRNLEEARRMKDQFFTDVSHELRTPLTTALLALEGGQGEAQAAVRPLHRLQKLVDEMLLLARIDAGPGLRSDDVTDLAAVIRRIVVEFNSGFRGKGLRFAAELPDGEAPVRIGAEAFERVAVNLIGNALKYTPSGGQVRVRVLAAGAQVRLEVEDDGPGIAPGDLERIFDRFVRVESRNGTPGIGVGLAIARELTTLHGGHIQCESEPGKGTLFRATWPRSHEPVSELPSSTPRVPEAIDAALDGSVAQVQRLRPPAPEGAPCVLVIEDHQDLAERIACSLGSGVRVEIAHDGAEGVERARALRPDLVVCDVLLPSLGGHEVVRRLRAEPLTAGAPILLLSALADRDHVLAGLQAGADDSMAKPFDAGMLRARVEALLRLKRRRDEASQANQTLRAFCQGMALALGHDAAVLLERGANGQLAVTASGGSELDLGATWGPCDAAWLAGTRPRLLTGLADAPTATDGFALSVAAPVPGQAQCALVFLSRDERRLRADELEIVAAAATCAAGMLDRERSVGTLSQYADEKQRLSSATLQGQDAERRRLALELHDGPGQTLVAALLHLDVELKALGARASLTHARTLVGQALADLRAVTRDLHPPSLAQHGLARTLQTLAQSLSSERMLVDSEIAAPLPGELPAAIALGLFRISQAALTNALRHAHARRAVVRLKQLPGLLELEIEDDGVGFIPSRTEHGVGLPGMRERATSLGGQLVIDSELGRGTRVRATVPLPFQG